MLRPTGKAGRRALEGQLTMAEWKAVREQCRKSYEFYLDKFKAWQKAHGRSAVRDVQLNLLDFIDVQMESKTNLGQSSDDRVVCGSGCWIGI